MKREAIMPAVIAKLTAEFPLFAVVENDFSNDAGKAMEEPLKGNGEKPTGVCIAVPPLLGTKKKTQAGNRVVSRAAFVVQLRVNRNMQKVALPEFDPYATHSAIENAIVSINPNEIETGDPDGNCTALILADQPNFSHGIHFTCLVTQ